MGCHDSRIESPEPESITYHRACELLPYELFIPSRTSRLEEISKWFGPDAKPIVRGRIAHLLSAYELTRLGVGITIYPASAGDIANLMTSASKKS